MKKYLLILLILFLPSLSYGVSCNTTIASTDTFPCEMSSASTTYTLSENIVCSGTCFTITATGVTLDLNDKTLTFGNANNPGILNDTFENWDDVNTPQNWTIIDGTATRVASTWPYKVYDAELSATASIKSGNVTLNMGQTYAYYSWIEGSSGDSYTVGIYLASNDSLLASTTISGAYLDRGFAMEDGSLNSGTEQSYKPGENQSIYLRIDCSGTSVKRLAMADIKPVTHFGITHHNYLNTTYYPDLDSSLFGGTIAGFLIKDGTINQGNGYGIKSTAICLRGTNTQGTIQNVITNMKGRNTGSIYSSSHGNLTIDNVDTDTISNAQFNRMHSIAGLTVIADNSSLGLVEIKNCSVLNDPEIGMNLSGSGVVPETSTMSFSVHDNTIRQKEQVTEGYGIAVSNLNGADIYSNLIKPYLGRGIISDTSGTAWIKNLTIRNNIIEDLYEVRNMEYAATSLEVAGIRFRNWGDDPLQGIRIYGNTITGSTDSSGVHAVYGININLNHPNDDVEIYNNTINVSATGSGYFGVGIALQSLGDVGLSVPFKIHNNAINGGLQSYGFILGGSDTAESIVQNLRIYSNIITSQYDPFHFWGSDYTYSDIDIYCNQIVNLGTDKYPFYFQGTISDIYISNNSITNSNSSGYEAYVTTNESSDIIFCNNGTIDVNGGGSVGSASLPCQDGSENCYTSAGLTGSSSWTLGSGGSISLGSGGSFVIE